MVSLGLISQFDKIAGVEHIKEMDEYIGEIKNIRQ